MSFFDIPHLIDGFLFAIPDEFDLSIQGARILSGIFTVFLVLSIALAAQDRLAGYYLCLFWGSFLALASILKHIPHMIRSGSYWSGWFSGFLIYGLIVSDLGLRSAIKHFKVLLETSI